MTSVVLDASSVLAGFFPDEVHLRRHDVMTLLGDGLVIAPMIWPAEIANGLFQAVRRRRTSWEDARGLLAALAVLKIELVNVEFAEMETAILPIARRHSLTAYDALYLHLAKSRRLPLHSSDNALCRAAEAENVSLA